MWLKLTEVSCEFILLALIFLHRVTKWEAWRRALAVKDLSNYDIFLQECLPRLPGFITNTLSKMPSKRREELMRRSKVANAFAENIVKNKLRGVATDPDPNNSLSLMSGLRYPASEFGPKH